MILLILAIVFGIAAGLFYVRYRNDEAKERQWTGTLYTLLAAIAFAFLCLFLFWCIFFNEDAAVRDHTDIQREGWERPDHVRVEGLPERAGKEPEAPKPKLPDAYRQQASFRPASLYPLPEDSLVWLKLYLPAKGRKAAASKLVYRFAMAGKRDTVRVEADSAQVTFVRDTQPSIKVTCQWRIDEYPVLGRQPSLERIHYRISPPANVKWITFRPKE